LSHDHCHFSTSRIRYRVAPKPIRFTESTATQIVAPIRYRIICFRRTMRGNTGGGCDDRTLSCYRDTCGNIERDTP